MCHANALTETETGIQQNVRALKMFVAYHCHLSLSGFPSQSYLCQRKPIKVSLSVLLKLGELQSRHYELRVTDVMVDILLVYCESPSIYWYKWLSSISCSDFVLSHITVRKVADASYWYYYQYASLLLSLLPYLKSHFLITLLLVNG